MPQLTFPVVPVGLAVSVWLGLDSKTMSALRVAGQRIPAPVQARGLLDTGSDVTSVASWLLRHLSIPVTATSSTYTAAGLVPVDLFEVSLSITDPTQPRGVMLTQPSLLVSVLPSVIPTADVLVGLDVLLQCRFLLDGPARHFMLDF